MLILSKKKTKVLPSPRNQKRWVVLIFLLAILLGLLLAKSMLIGIGLFGGIMGLLIVLLCVMNAEAGVYINLVYSLFSFYISRLFFNDQFPIGVVSNILIVATFLGIFVKGKTGRQILNEFTQTAVARSMLIIFFYIMLELFNPNAHSFEGWYGAMRALLMNVLLLFAAYAVFDNWRSIRRFIIAMFLVCGVVAVYGCFQQWHGLFDYEINWVAADPARLMLTYIAGDYRKFSTMPDTQGFGILMAACSVFFLIMLAGPWRAKVKWMIFPVVCLMLLGTAYSGTRTANAMVIGGLAFFMLLTINKRSTIIFAAAGVVIFGVLMFGPFSGNPTIVRFRTTFTGNKDESFNVRTINRKRIQPYIHEHPIGGGLGTTGPYGAMYNPGHYLAGFPPDSGYMKKALEIGWIGLVLVIVYYYFIARAGVSGYFICTNEKAKNIYAAATCCIFSFYVAEFAQDAVGQITDSSIYYPIIAILLRLKDFEHEIS
jgi:putative inorganic carbon (hco3(-)) transporter